VTFSFSYVISVLINYKSTDILRKTANHTKPETPKKSARPRKTRLVKKLPSRNSLSRESVAALAPSLPAVRPPAPGSGKRGAEGHIAYLLRQAQAATRLTMERALADLGVTPPQFAVLTMLNAYPGLSGADVARVALLTPQTVGVIIGNLERDGAIRKTPHPVHGRVLQWTLTRRGANLLDQCRRRVGAVERRLVAGLGAKAEVTIRRWLSRIATDLHEDD
jgi:DNA-binding MarR family transcriptional regulator